jgi:Ni2+-binding GTPase involved in maturation of urease and hydrogenase
LVALNKIDLAEVVGVDVNSLERGVLKINSSVNVVRVGAKTKTGIKELANALENLNMHEFSTVKYT